MSKLDDLIKELCPNGVEYKTLENIALIKARIGWQGLTKDEYLNSGDYYLVTGVDFKDGLVDWDNCHYVTKDRYDQDTNIQIKNDDVLVTKDGTLGKVAFVQGLTKPATLNSGVFVIRSLDKNICNKFLFHYLKSPYLMKFANSKLTGGTIKHLNQSVITQLPIPVPPLPVQEEIVRILDKFTSLTAELTAELTARRKQYEYYRDELLTFGDDVEWKTLGELFSFIRNGFVGTVTPYFTDKEHGVRYLEGTNIHNGIISDNEILYVNKDFHQKHIRNELKEDDILMVQSGHIGECAVVGEKYKGCNCHALIIMSNGGSCLSKYVVHYFHTVQGFKQLTPAITGGTLKHVLAGKMGRIRIPVPSLEEQEKIVSILDRFESLCNDITSGLPAEIEARKKQYEYYRDLLLTFKPFVSTSLNER